jgi:glycosyltransferase involved in cell wall biosynthesis
MSSHVSLIVPTFNRAPLIGETIESLLTQTVAPAEVIVVDDGSTDDTAAVVNRYGARVRYHRVENTGSSNVGPSAARNVGVSLAASPWIAFCDSDDLWLPTKLERQLRLHTLCPTVEFSFTDATCFMSDKWEDASYFARAPVGFWEPQHRVVEDTIWVYEVSLYDRVLRFQPALASTLLMSKRRFERLGGYNERFSQGLSEDLEFVLRNLGEPPIGVLAEPLAGIRRHEANRSRDLFDLWMGQVRILEHALAAHSAAQPFSSLVRDEIQRRRTFAAARAFTSGRLDTVRELAPSIESRYWDWKLRLRVAIATLPMPLARLAQRSLVAANRYLSKLI